MGAMYQCKRLTILALLFGFVTTFLCGVYMVLSKECGLGVVCRMGTYGVENIIEVAGPDLTIPTGDAVCRNNKNNTKRTVYFDDSSLGGAHMGINWQQPSDATSPRRSEFTILDLKPDYRLCDAVTIAIRTRNSRGEDKSYGGDFFRVKMFTKFPTFTASSSTDGEIVDLQNGTYLARFTMKWTGAVRFTVTLVHSSEAVDVIRRFRDAAPARYVYRGKFVSSDKTHREETFCNVAFPVGNKLVCNMTDQRTGSPWFCYKPTSPHLTCRDWTEHRCDSRASTRTELMPTLRPLEAQIVTSKQAIPGRINFIKVYENNINSNTTALPRTSVTVSVADLPTCTVGSHTTMLASYAGFYHNNIWHSAHCRTNHFVPKMMETCLAGKRLYFLGDSTIRQLFEFYLKKLAPNLKKTPPGWEPQWHVGPTYAVNAVTDTNMTFRFHAYPIGRNAWAAVKDINYIANELDTIAASANSNTVVVISLWAHFTAEPEWFFEHRMRTITEAVARLHARSPSTLVVFKSANTRHFSDLTQRVYSSDWLARRVDQIMRKYVLLNEKVAFIDAWDMSSAQLIPDDIHPAGAHVENLSDQLLTFMCNNAAA